LGNLPIFIIGISQRSGTHYLYDLLLRHPDCRPALTATSPWGSWEDHLLHFSDELSRYADALVASNSLNDEATRRLLMRSLGDGLMSFVTNLDNVRNDARRAVTKSPLPENLDRFAELFPGATAVLMVREPSAVITSAMRTFGRDIDHWVRIWDDGARWILQFLDQHPGAAVLVRYEDLYADPVSYMRSLLPRLGLGAERYDFTALRRLPVRGSSQLGVSPDGVRWAPVTPDTSFDPLRRGHALSSRDQERLRWHALPEMKALGYAREDEISPEGLRFTYYQSRNALARVSRGARLAFRDLYEAQGRRLARRRRRPGAVP
jgi:hypothetical protein